jgi:hypothetical protein
MPFAERSCIMEIVVFVVCIIVGFSFLALTFRAMHKDHGTIACFCASLAGFFLLCGLPWVQGLAKTWIVSNVGAKLAALGNQMDDVQKTTASMQNDIAQHQKELDKHQKELADQQTRIRTTHTNITAQQGSITYQYEQIAQLQAKLASTQTNIAEQQEKLSDVTYWVNNLYVNLTNDMLSVSDTNRIVLNNVTNIGLGICITLRHVPIPQSIQVTAFTTEGFNIPQPIDPPYGTYKNLLFGGLKGYNAKTTTLRIQYVKDTRRTHVTQKVQLRGASYYFGDKWIGDCNTNGIRSISDDF